MLFDENADGGQHGAADRIKRNADEGIRNWVCMVDETMIPQFLNRLNPEG